MNITKLLYSILLVASCSLWSCGDTNPNVDENNRDYHGFDQSGSKAVNKNRHPEPKKENLYPKGGGRSAVIGKKYYDHDDNTLLNDNVNDPDAGASSNMDTVPLRKK